MNIGRENHLNATETKLHAYPTEITFRIQQECDSQG